MATRISVLCGHVAAWLCAPKEQPKAAAAPRPAAVAASPNQVIVITGCTSGLGLHLAKEFVRLGHRVAGCGRRGEVIAALNKELGANGSFFMVTDVSKEAELGAFAAAVYHQFGDVDMLIANAGIGAAGKAPWEIPAEHIQKIVDISVKGVMLTNTHFIPMMLGGLDKERPDGPLKKVVNISSGVAHTTMPWAADYCAVKFAVEGFSKCTAQGFKELKNYKPGWEERIICVPFAPGVVQTELNQNPDIPTAETWCKEAAPYLLGLQASDNGKSLVMPGWYDEDYQATWVVPADHPMNARWTKPMPPKK